MQFQYVERSKTFGVINMNARLLILGVILAIFIVLFNLLAPKTKNEVSFQEGIFDQAIVSKIEANSRIYPDKTEISLAVILGDSVQYLGILKEGHSLVSVENEDKLFEIGSISKVFLTTLLTICLEQGYLELDDPIQEHLPIELSEYELAGQAVLIQHLANHTSGIHALPEGLIKDYEYEISDEDEIAIVSKYLSQNCTYDFKPGSSYAYSNLGMSLLCMIVCDKLGGDFESLVDYHIGRQIGLENTIVNLSPAQRQQMVVGYNEMGAVAPLIISDLYVCSGSLKSSTRDMVKFVKANMDDLAPFVWSHDKTYEIDEDYDVALGWHYSKMHAERVYYHHGGTMGYSSGIAFEKDNKVGIVVLTNISALLKDRPDITKLMYDLFGQIEQKIARVNT